MGCFPQRKQKCLLTKSNFLIRCTAQTINYFFVTQHNCVDIVALRILAPVYLDNRVFLPRKYRLIYSCPGEL